MWAFPSLLPPTSSRLPGRVWPTAPPLRHSSRPFLPSPCYLAVWSPGGVQGLSRRGWRGPARAYLFCGLSGRRPIRSLWRFPAWDRRLTLRLLPRRWALGRSTLHRLSLFSLMYAQSLCPRCGDFSPYWANRLVLKALCYRRGKVKFCISRYEIRIGGLCQRPAHMFAAQSQNDD